MNLLAEALQGAFEAFPLTDYHISQIARPLPIVKFRLIISFGGDSVKPLFMSQIRYPTYFRRRRSPKVIPTPIAIAEAPNGTIIASQLTPRAKPPVGGNPGVGVLVPGIAGVAVGDAVGVMTTRVGVGLCQMGQGVGVGVTAGVGVETSKPSPLSLTVMVGVGVAAGVGVETGGTMGTGVRVGVAVETGVGVGEA